MHLNSKGKDAYSIKNTRIQLFQTMLGLLYEISNVRGLDAVLLVYG